jgi:hypothetical protein
VPGNLRGSGRDPDEHGSGRHVDSLADASAYRGPLERHTLRLRSGEVHEAEQRLLGGEGLAAGVLDLDEIPVLILAGLLQPPAVRSEVN